MQGFPQRCLGGTSGTEVRQGQSLMNTVRAIENIIVGLDLRHLFQSVQGEIESRVDYGLLRAGTHPHWTVVSSQTLC